MELNKIYCEDCMETLKRMSDSSIDNCITSPPYYGLRDYQVEGQIGLEETPEQYVQKLVEIFREVRRAMKPDGTLWLNLGDSYSGSNSDNRSIVNKDSISYSMGQGRSYIQRSLRSKIKGLKPKDLIGIPWMVAFALRSNGWYLRQDIIWSKPNPMPESVTDRCTKAHEYIFLLSKSQRYYYDAEAILEKANYDGRKDTIMKGSEKYQNGFYPTDVKTQSIATVGHEMWSNKIDDEIHARNKRSVWTVTTKPFSEAHFAVYPEKLIEPCVLTTKKDAIIYDPFGGAGTTGVVALRAGRKFIMSELNPEYVKIAEKRLKPYLHNLFT